MKRKEKEKENDVVRIFFLYQIH